MGQLTEKDVRRIFRESLADPLAFPPEFKAWLPAWLEINQPVFHLNQLLGWSGYVGSNDVRTCSSQLALTSAEQSVPGIATTLYNPAKYLIAANVGAKRGTGAVSDEGLGVGTGATTDNSAGNAWVNPSNITAQDATNATCALTTGAHSDFLWGTNLGFVIPSGVTIQGVIVYFRAGASANYANVGPFTVVLTKAGVQTGSSKQFTLTADALTDYGLGGASDLWGASLTGPEVSDSTFGVWASIDSGVTASMTVNVDVVSVNITTDKPWAQITNTLYVGGSAQSPALIVPYSQFADATTATNSVGTWFVNTTAANQTLDLKAVKDGSAGGGTIETTTQLSIARIS